MTNTVTNYRSGKSKAFFRGLSKDPLYQSYKDALEVNDWITVDEIEVQLKERIEGFVENVSKRIFRSVTGQDFPEEGTLSYTCLASGIISRPGALRRQIEGFSDSVRRQSGRYVPELSARTDMF